jgi:TonB family protein
VKKYVPILFLFCIPVALKAQNDTLTQKINKLPYVRVDSDPKFPGQPFERYLSDHLQIHNSLKAVTAVNAVLAMKIESNGSISDVKLLKNISPEVDREILRIASTSPKWQPAIAGKTPVGVYVVYNIAVAGKKKQEAVSPTKNINITSVTTQSTAITKPVVKKIPATIPEFPGGDDAFSNYLRTNIAYPANAKKNGIQGVVLIIFVINADGSIGQTRIISSPSPDLSQEATRVIRGSPKWKPATENGKPVESSRTIPINFQFKP